MENAGSQVKQNKYFWIFGAVVLLLAGWFFWKMIFGEGDYKVTLVDAPREANVGNVTFTWRIDGPSTTINQTTVYYGLFSNPGVLEKNIKPAETKYTDFVKDFVSGKFNIPLQFIGNTVIAKPGQYYFRLYALIKDKNYWSEEYSLTVKPAGDYQISIIDAPQKTGAGSMVTFTWRIDGVPTTINHTSVHFGTASTSGQLGTEVKPSETNYTDMVTDFASGKFDISLQFVGNVKIATSGSYFYRAHALVNGKNYWTDEYSLEVK